MSVASITPNYTANQPLTFPGVGNIYTGEVSDDELEDGTLFTANLNVSSGNYLVTYQLDIVLKDATTTFTTSNISISADGNPMWLEDILLTPEGGNYGPWNINTILSFLGSAIVPTINGVISINLTPEFANSTTAPEGTFFYKAIKLSDI
jgi:hypothetical protein